ncbi:NAB region 2 [Dictyocaulus viviparus]|uniref:NAB region 2 n=1 Tax=Dictyocaulus viviparus TaxID=29172 RepID=A0A0D8Y2I4_DICVI|nr:NAB region 2 [Dictyocaulus viviparus]
MPNRNKEPSPSFNISSHHPIPSPDGSVTDHLSVTTTMSSSDGNNTPSPSSVASSSQQPSGSPNSTAIVFPLRSRRCTWPYREKKIQLNIYELSALPTSSSSKLQIPSTAKNSIKRESPQLKSESVARTSTPKALTPPTSISEWQLLAVLQRANLVQYYDMFISQGKNTPKALTPPTSISEWQLLAVLQRANLVQYYDMFISQDMNRTPGNPPVQRFSDFIMILENDCTTQRVQQTGLIQEEFSKDQTTFNLAAIQHIGPPPVSPYALGGPDMSFLMPEVYEDSKFSLISPVDEEIISTNKMFLGEAGKEIFIILLRFAATLTNLSSTSPGLTATSTENTSPQNGNATHNSVPLAIELSAAVLGTMASSVAINNRSVVGDFTGGTPIPTPGGTANVVRGEFLPAFGQGSITVTGEEKERSSSPLSVGGDFVSLGDYDPNTALCDSPVLSDAQIRRLSTCAMAICQKIPRLPPKLVQNKKRVSKEVLDLLSASADTPNRLADYRKYSAIYGRFDAKRKPDKGLSFHEVSVNEAAAQLCLIMPSLLTRRDELFPLARQVVKDAGYHYAKASRKRGLDHLDSHSPQSSPTYSPCLGDDNEVEVDNVFGSSTVKQSDEKRKKSDTRNDSGPKQNTVS